MTKINNQLLDQNIPLKHQNLEPIVEKAEVRNTLLKLKTNESAEMI